MLIQRDLPPVIDVDVHIKSDLPWDPSKSVPIDETKDGALIFEGYRVLHGDDILFEFWGGKRGYGAYPAFLLVDQGYDLLRLAEVLRALRDLGGWTRARVVTVGEFFFFP